MSEHHDAVKLLLARMESHPEEFAGINMTKEAGRLHTSRWNTVLWQFWHTLTTEEQDALNNALSTANRNNFHRAVMQELLDPKTDWVGRQMELFPAQSAYPPGNMPTKLMVNPDITQQALQVLQDEMEHNAQRQRGR